MRKRVVVGAAGAAATVAVVAGGVAVAGQGGDDGPQSHQYTPAQGRAATRAALAATGWLYTPPDIIKRQAMRANLLAKATATNFGGFRSSSEASHGVGL